MYLPIGRVGMHLKRNKTKRLSAKLKAKNRRRVNGMRGRKLSKRLGKAN